MRILTVRGMPAWLYLALRKRAERNHRSLNSEIIACLEKMNRPPTLDVDRWLANVARLRGGAKLPRISSAEVTRLKNRGRNGD